MEQLVNDVQTTLNGGIDDNDTAIAVDDATGFPLSGDFRIRVGSEIMLVTAVASNVFTVTRGIESTTAVAHATGAKVDPVYTELSVHKRILDFRMQGNLASLPAAGIAGRQYIANDSFYTFIDDGSAWQAFYKGQRVKRPPDISNWTLKDQGGSTMDDYRGGLRLRREEPNSVQTFRSIVKAPPSTPFTIVARVEFFGTDSFNISAGLLYRRDDPGINWHAGIGTHINSVTEICAFSHRNFNPGSFLQTNLQTIGVQNTLMPHWWKFADSGSARWLGYSFDGYEWRYLVTNDSSGLFYTVNAASNYDWVGFYMWGGSQPFGSAFLISWEEFNSVIL